MREKTAQKLLKKVKADYQVITDDFDNTRSYPGKEFPLFDKYLVKNANIVDLGCGNGRLAKYLIAAYKNLELGIFNYTGIDNSLPLLEKAGKNLGESNLELAPLAVEIGTSCVNINFIEGDQMEIPLKSAQADLVFNIRAFHHIPTKSKRLLALKEIKRILKPGGILILTVWNLWQKKYFRFLFGSFLRFFYTFFDYAPNDAFIPWGKKAKRYYHAFLPGELLKLFKLAGFNVIDKYYVTKGKKTPFLKSYEIVIIAQKHD